MAKSRKQKVEALASKMQNIVEELLELSSDLRDSHDETPENLQGSDRFQAAEEGIQSLENLTSDIDDNVRELWDVEFS